MRFHVWALSTRELDLRLMAQVKGLSLGPCALRFLVLEGMKGKKFNKWSQSIHSKITPHPPLDASEVLGGVTRVLNKEADVNYSIPIERTAQIGNKR